MNPSLPAVMRSESFLKMTFIAPSWQFYVSEIVITHLIKLPSHSNNLPYSVLEITFPSG